MDYQKKLSEFSKAFKDAFSKSKNNKEDKKGLDLEIRTTKEDINGTSLEIFTFDKAKYFEYFDYQKEYFNDNLFCFSLNLDVKEEAGLTSVVEYFNSLKALIESIPKKTLNAECYSRSEKKHFSFDILIKEGLLIETLLNLNIDITEYHKFNLILKLGIILEELLNPKEDINIILQKIYSIFFSIKAETNNIKCLFNALIEGFKAIKLNEEKEQKRLDEVVNFFYLINSFIKSKLKLEFDSKVLSNETTIPEFETLKSINNLFECMIIPTIISWGFVEAVKAINFDKISLCIGFSKYHNGLAILLKIPG